MTKMYRYSVSPSAVKQHTQPMFTSDICIFLCPGATKDMGKMLGGEEEKDPDAAKKEEERQEALRQQEEERKAKHARMEAEREKVRQTIRDKVENCPPVWAVLSHSDLLYFEHFLSNPEILFCCIWVENRAWPVAMATFMMCSYSGKRLYVSSPCKLVANKLNMLQIFSQPDVKWPCSWKTSLHRLLLTSHSP